MEIATQVAKTEHEDEIKEMQEEEEEQEDEQEEEQDEEEQDEEQDEEEQDEEEQEKMQVYDVKIPHIIIVSDQLFTLSGKYQFLQNKQTGYMPGHYWKIDGAPARLSASATGVDDKSAFKVYTLIYTINGKDEEFNIVESVKHPRKVIALDKRNDKVIVKTCSKSPNKFRRWQDVVASDPEILLLRHPLGNSPVFSMYEFYTTGSTYYGLGFGFNGKPMKPSSVSLMQAESLFRTLDY